VHDIFTSKVFFIMITFAVFFLSQKLYSRFKFFFFNPVLVTISTLILFLKLSEIPYQEYFEGGKMISFFLGPSVVALGVPLYLQLEEIKKRGKSILLSLVLGSVLGIVSVVGIASLLGASKKVIFSLAPKAVTTPIAMGITEKLGGILPLTAALVITTGILGAVLGPSFLRLLKIKSPIAFGLAMGAASHGIGTARAAEEGELQGAISGLALCLNGIITAILMPFVMDWMSFLGFF